MKGEILDIKTINEIKELNKQVIKLENENQELKEEFAKLWDECNKLKDKYDKDIEYLGKIADDYRDKNKELKSLCNKYEEEHKTTFEEWKKDINIIDELEKWLNEYYESNRKWYNTELSNHDKKYYEREYRNTEFMIVKFKKQLNKLKGDNK